MGGRGSSGSSKIKSGAGGGSVGSGGTAVAPQPAVSTPLPKKTRDADFPVLSGFRETMFHDSFAKAHSSLSEDVRSSFHKYTTNLYYYNLNLLMRTGSLSASASGVRDTTALNRIRSHMESAYDKPGGSLPHNVTLFRGMDREGATYKSGLLQQYKSSGSLLGVTFVEKGFGSTSTDSTVSERFQGEVFMRIRAPKGAKALSIKGLSSISTEQEVLFKPGTKFRIVEEKLSNPGTSYERLDITVDVVD